MASKKANDGGTPADAAKARQQAFDAAEGPPDDLASMSRKLLRRIVANQTSAWNQVTSLAGEMRRKSLLRALNGDQELFELVSSRMSDARTQLRQHLMKAAALGLDLFSTRLDVYRGGFEQGLQRIRRGWQTEERMTAALDKLLGLKSEDVQLSIVRALIIKEMVHELIVGDDDTFPKLSEAEQRELVAWTIGESAEPPEIVKRLLRNKVEARPPAYAQAAPDLVRVDVLPMKLPGGRQLELGKDLEAEILIENRSSKDLPLNFSIGPCISIAPTDWTEMLNTAWLDARFQLPVDIKLEAKPGNWVPQAGSPLDKDVLAPLRQFGFVTVKATIPFKDDPPPKDPTLPQKRDQLFMRHQAEVSAFEAQVVKLLPLPTPQNKSQAQQLAFLKRSGKDHLYRVNIYLQDFGRKLTIDFTVPSTFGSVSKPKGKAK
jgi:hypothetical protein